MSSDTLTALAGVTSRTIEVTIDMPHPAPAGPVLDYFRELVRLADSPIFAPDNPVVELHEIVEGSYKAMFIVALAITADVAGLVDLAWSWRAGTVVPEEPACQAAVILVTEHGAREFTFSAQGKTVAIPAKTVLKFAETESKSLHIGRVGGGRVTLTSGEEYLLRRTGFALDRPKMDDSLAIVQGTKDGNKFVAKSIARMRE